MTNSSNSTEDILKLINHVSYKKTEGKLYLMAERLAWMTNTSDVFKISEHYKNIRAQRISPDDKDKVQLQLLMHSGSSFTFHFIHPDGRNKQISDRNSVKISLQYLIPRFKEKAQSELENKRKLCENNPQILELYRELVTNKYIFKEEFWKRTETSSDHQSLLNEYSKYPRGIPSWLLATPPQKDGKSQCNLSKQMADDIFAVYPAVRQKHAQLVPSEMSEEEFWNKFFQSHYFHRFKSDLSNDRFGSCAIYDIQQIEKEAQRLRSESLTLISDKGPDTGELCGDLQNGTRPVPDSTSSTLKQAISSSEELVRRFNRQSFLILKTMKSKPVTGSKRSVSNDDDPCSATVAAAAIDLASSSSDQGDAGDAKKKRPSTDITVSLDMYGDEEMMVMTSRPKNNQNSIDGIKFNTHKVSEYINKISVGTVGMVTHENNNNATNNRRLKQFLDDQKRKLIIMDQTSSSVSICGRPLTNLVSSTVATDVLTDIGHLFSDADIAMATYGMQSRNMAKIPQEMIRDVKALYRVSSELFRHFWDCFPITDSAGFEKLHRMVEAIKKFRIQKIDYFSQQHPNYYLLTGSMDNKPTDHLCKMTDRISDAFDRYMANYKRINQIA